MKKPCLRGECESEVKNASNEGNYNPTAFKYHVYAKKKFKYISLYKKKFLDILKSSTACYVSNIYSIDKLSI